jgi:ATP dependent DNA ligase domain
MARGVARKPSAEKAGLPDWIPPQLTELVDAAPEGPPWLHEIKLDGYRMHARLDRGEVRLLTRTGLDSTHKYPAIAAAVGSLGARQVYLDGELCGVRADGITSFSMIQPTSKTATRWSSFSSIFECKSPSVLLRSPGRAWPDRAIHRECPHRRMSGLSESVEKRFCRFEVGRVEPFGKPVVDRLEDCRRIGGTALIAQQPGEAGGAAQFPEQGPLAASPLEA